MNKLKFTFNLIIILPTQKKKNPEKSTNYLTTSELNIPPPHHHKTTTGTCICKRTVLSLIFAEGSGTLGHWMDGLEPRSQYGGRAELGAQ